MITTVKITHTDASLIRVVARKDMPEYGLKEGQLFYCAKSSSLGENAYHILVWDNVEGRWNCPCTCGEKNNHHVACKHTKAVNKDCKPVAVKAGPRTVDEARLARIARARAAGIRLVA